MAYDFRIDGYRNWELWVRWKAVTIGSRRPSNLEELFWALKSGAI